MLVRRFVLLLLGSLYFGCQSNSNDEPSSAVCPLTSELTALQSTNGDQKFKINPRAFKKPISTSPGNLLTDAVGALSMDTMEAPKGTELIILVDHQCTKDLDYKNSNHPDRKLSERVPSQNLRKIEPASRGTKLRSHTIKLERNFNYNELKKLVSNDPCLQLVNLAAKAHRLAVPTDPKYVDDTQSHHNAIGMDTAYDYFYSTPGITTDVIIAIIDNGVQLTHPDLDDNLWVNTGEIDGNSIDDDGNNYVDDVNGYNFPEAISDPSPQDPCTIGTDSCGKGHGTHVAGLAAAEANNGVGGLGLMGSHGKIMAINVFGTELTTEFSHIENAIRYAADNGAKVINLSLGGWGEVATTRAAIEYAISQGAFIVAAAGNDHAEIVANTESSFFFSPASYAGELDGLIAVGSTDVANADISSFSNFSATCVDLAAPGATDSISDPMDGVYSTTANGSYEKMSGTSMAAPVVSGAAALAIGRRLTMGNTVTPAQIEALMISGSETNASLTSVIRNGRVLDLITLSELIGN